MISLLIAVKRKHERRPNTLIKIILFAGSAVCRAAHAHPKGGDGEGETVFAPPHVGCLGDNARTLKLN